MKLYNSLHEAYKKNIIKNKIGCWGWKGSVSRGYGKVKYKSGRYLAHRLSWFIHKGEIPKELWVLHKCDNRICSNPDHLFLGTLQDNNKDRDNKKRHWRKITPEQIIEIKQLLNNGKRGIGIYLAKKYNVSTTLICKIKKNKGYFLKYNDL